VEENISSVGSNHQYIQTRENQQNLVYIQYNTSNNEQNKQLKMIYIIDNTNLPTSCDNILQTEFNLDREDINKINYYVHQQEQLVQQQQEEQQQCTKEQQIRSEHQLPVDFIIHHTNTV
jgi:ATP-dependent Clp protease adapter protein ClpS